jgi:signal peptidase
LDDSLVIILKKDSKKHPILTNKKIMGPLKFVLSVASIIALGYVLFNYVPFIAKYDHYVIATNSMEPVIDVGDIVIIDTDVNYEELEAGDIIAFYADIRGDGKQEVVVHYLASVTTGEEGRTYRTKPEVSEELDPWTLDDADLVGTHVATIPKIGPVLLFAQSTIGRIALILDVVLIYVLFSFFPSTKKPNKPDKIEDKKAEETM